MHHDIMSLSVRFGMTFSVISPPVSHLTGDDIHIWRFGTCLLITYVPLSPSLTVKTPC